MVPKIVEILETVELRKSFGYRILFEEVNLSFEAGKVYCISGANGTGKTTLLSCLTGLSSSSGGKILYKNHSLEDCEQEYRSRMFLIDQNFYFYKDLTLAENLSFFMRLHSGKSLDIGILRQICNEFEMLKFLNFSVGDFSSGMKRKVRLILLKLLAPEVIFLDEPFNNLDRRTDDKLWQILKENTSTGSVVLMVTHQPENCFEQIDGWVFLSGKRISQVDCSAFTECSSLQNYLKAMQ